MIQSIAVADSRIATPQRRYFINPSTSLVLQQEIAQERLRNSGYRSLRNVDCNLESGVMKLTGRVPSFFMKQIAQEIVRHVDGVTHVKNHLEVIVATTTTKS